MTKKKSQIFYQYYEMKTFFLVADAFGRNIVAIKSFTVFLI